MANIHSVFDGRYTHAIFDRNSLQLDYGDNTRVISIPGNSDLNNYTTAGVFFYTRNSSEETIENAPPRVGTAFKLIVLKPANYNNTKQIVIPDNSNFIWVRSTTNQVFESWHQIAFLDEIPSITVDGTTLKVE